MPAVSDQWGVGTTRCGSSLLSGFVRVKRDRDDQKTPRISWLCPGCPGFAVDFYIHDANGALMCSPHPNPYYISSINLKNYDNPDNPDKTRKSAGFSCPGTHRFTRTHPDR